VRVKGANQDCRDRSEDEASGKRAKGSAESNILKLKARAGVDCARSRDPLESGRRNHAKGGGGAGSSARRTVQFLAVWEKDRAKNLNRGSGREGSAIVCSREKKPGRNSAFKNSGRKKKGKGYLDIFEICWKKSWAQKGVADRKGTMMEIGRGKESRLEEIDKPVWAPQRDLTELITPSSAGKDRKVRSGISRFGFLT